MNQVLLKIEKIKEIHDAYSKDGDCDIFLDEDEVQVYIGLNSPKKILCKIDVVPDHKKPGLVGIYDGAYIYDIKARIIYNLRSEGYEINKKSEKEIMIENILKAYDEFNTEQRKMLVDFVDMIAFCHKEKAKFDKFKHRFFYESN